jgi:hypothetical protein
MRPRVERAELGAEQSVFSQAGQQNSLTGWSNQVARNLIPLEGLAEERAAGGKVS